MSTTTSDKKDGQADKPDWQALADAKRREIDAEISKDIITALEGVAPESVTTSFSYQFNPPIVVKPSGTPDGYQLVWINVSVTRYTSGPDEEGSHEGYVQINGRGYRLTTKGERDKRSDLTSFGLLPEAVAGPLLLQAMMRSGNNIQISGNDEGN